MFLTAPAARQACGWVRDLEHALGRSIGELKIGQRNRVIAEPLVHCALCYRHLIEEDAVSATERWVFAHADARH